MTKSSHFDSATYEEAKTHLKAAFEHSVAAGRDAWELTEFALEKFGDSVGPYLRQFMSDVGEGRIKLRDLADSAKTAVVGQQVTAGERELMIREAAYLRAEQRGFAGGSPEEDWLIAEREVDEQLAREAGLVVQGRQALATATIAAEQELANARDIITRWLEKKSTVTTKPTTKRTTRKKVVTDTSSAAKKKAAPVRKTAENKAVERKKTVSKKSAPAKKKAAPTGKTAGKKVAARKKTVKKKSSPAKK